MTSFVYLACLLAGIACMLLLDARFRLFWWHDARRAAMVTVCGVVVLLAADVAGIVWGLFLRGDSPYATGVVLAPHMPLEEPFFLVFLVLCTMVCFTGAHRLLLAREARGPQ